jgi:hypothetical protein
LKIKFHGVEIVGKKVNVRFCRKAKVTDCAWNVRCEEYRNELCIFEDGNSIFNLGNQIFKLEGEPDLN